VIPYLTDDGEESSHQDDSFLIGMDAVMNADFLYKNAYRVKEKNIERGVVNPLVDYFISIIGKGMLPKIKGLSQSKDSLDTLCLDQTYIRQDQASALATAIQNSRHVRKVSLANCGLTDETFITILKSIDPFTLQ
jgi:hypothetical protein